MLLDVCLPILCTYVTLHSRSSPRARRERVLRYRSAAGTISIARGARETQEKRVSGVGVTLTPNGLDRRDGSLVGSADDVRTRVRNGSSGSGGTGGGTHDGGGGGGGDGGNGGNGGSDGGGYGGSYDDVDDAVVRGGRRDDGGDGGSDGAATNNDNVSANR
nr:PREDICTED: glycine, alanine and asparagine-rich protein-like [Linepithema humile]